MPNQNARQLTIELCWWGITAMLVTLVLLFVNSKAYDFPFYLYNAVFIVVALTMTRYIFTLHFSWMRKQFLLQGVLSFLMIFIVFYMGQGLNEYTTYMDNYGPDVLVKHLASDEKMRVKSYIDSEYYLFGIWGIVAGIVFPFRMIYNLWTNYKELQKPRRKA